MGFENKYDIEDGVTEEMKQRIISEACSLNPRIGEVEMEEAIDAVIEEFNKLGTCCATSPDDIRKAISLSVDRYALELAMDIVKEQTHSVTVNIDSNGLLISFYPLCEFGEE